MATRLTFTQQLQMGATSKAGAVARAVPRHCRPVPDTFITTPHPQEPEARCFFCLGLDFRMQTLSTRVPNVFLRGFGAVWELNTQASNQICGLWVSHQKVHLLDKCGA